jgi:outer membrane immunogenic protein
MNMRLKTAVAVAITWMAAPQSFAADVYVPPPEAPLIAPAPFDWSGFYIGVHAGYAWANRNGCWDFGSTTVDCGTDFDETFDYGQKGPLVGAQGGYNWAWSNFLLGVEVDASLADVTGELNPGDTDGGVGTWNWLASASARLGWAHNNWLLYAKGGYALGDFDFAGNSGCNFNMNHHGPLAGAGVEWRFSQHASVKLEYNHIWFDTRKTPCTAFGFIPTAVETGASMDVVKVGINYNFGP